MNKQNFIFSLLTVIMFSSCIIVNDYGPHGRDGDAYFGVSYHFAPPYSYWDNNPDIPENPYLGEFYWTDAGIYDFEYFVNPFDYWYGSYTIYRNAGGHGGPYGEEGIDGIDTYLMMYCDPNGWHEDRFDYKSNVQVEKDQDKITITVNEPSHHFKLEMYKTDILDRPTQNTPKWRQ